VPLTASPKATSNVETQLACVFNGGSYYLASLRYPSLWKQFNEITTVMASSARVIYAVFVATEVENSYRKVLRCHFNKP
jgi:hypothetical protein